MQGIDPLILGANPLVGIDHYSRARGRDRALGVDVGRIRQVMISSFESGAGGFTIGVDPVLYGVLQALQEIGDTTPFGVYLILPDMRTYSRAFLTQGTLGVMKELLANLSLTEKAKALAQGGLAMLTTAPARAMNMYIDIEISRLSGILPPRAQIRAVLSFEAITDMMVAFKVKDIFRDYVSHVADSHHVKPGFVTRNFPRFVDFCDDCGIKMRDVVVMTPFNEIGFQMTPSRQACEKVLNRIHGENVIGMSLLAGGACSLDSAIDYVRRVSDLQSVVVGASTASHARETFTGLKQVIGSRNQV